MRLLNLPKRPWFVILVGVFFIGFGVIRAQIQMPSQIGESAPGILYDIVPTPNFYQTPTPVEKPEYSPVIPASKPADELPIQMPKSSSALNKKAIFGKEPKANPILDQINAAGKEFPVWILIPSIKVSAPVVFATMRKVLMDGKTVDMWFAPDSEAAGWHTTSAFPGDIGNLVMSGHNNDYGHVFRELIDLNQGDEILIITQKRLRTYYVANTVLFQEVEIGLVQRQENARWISPSPDERLTLVTCWPDDSNTHRLIIVASPGNN